MNLRDQILKTSDLAAVVQSRGVPLKQAGKELVACCPFHDERTPSFTVTPEKQLFFCHGCGAGGNAIDFVMRFDGLEFPAALDRLTAELNIQKPDAPKPRQRGKIVQTYDYIDENGELVYQVCRMDPKDFRQRRPDGNGWSWSVKGLPSVPYNLPAMLAKPTATVIIVEGEKDADNAIRAGLLATTNSGGSKKWPPELNRYFTDRRVVIVPDNDDPGRAHADMVASALHRVAESVRVVNLPNLPPKGDISDWLAGGGTVEQFIALCKSAQPWQPVHDDHPPLPDQPDHDAPPPWAEDDAPHVAGAPFRALGFDDGAYYFLPHKTQQLTSISAGAMASPAQLLTLAPLEWFEAAFAGRSGVAWQQAASTLMRLCESAGTFDIGAVRGRGAWFDAGRSVLHLGTRLLVDRQTVALHALDSRFIYQRAPATESDMPEPLTLADVGRVVEISESMNWHRDVDRVQFIGWLVLAPICGALSWRPHVWITSKRGSGKSWLMDNIVHPLIGSAALVVQGNSTEAGIRQQLKQDARPILFDEAEGEHDTGRKRMQSVLELARQASSDGAAQIAKGTAGGKALTYRVRSMFLLSSINVGLSQASDRSRFSVLSLKQPDPGPAGRQQFDRLAKLVNDTLTADYCTRFRSRIYGMIPTIRQNAATFAKAAAERIGNQRAGDQVGALLAGFYALLSDGRVTAGEAAAYIAGLDWSDQADERTESDEATLLSEILHAQIRLDTSHGSRTRSVAELVTFLQDGNDAELTNDTAKGALLRHGIKVRDDSLILSNSHPELRKILERTPWAGGWGRILARMEGATSVPGEKFAGVVHRAVRLPFKSVFG